MFVTALVVFLVAMYFFSWPGLLVTTLGLLVLLVAYQVFWVRPRVEAANAILYEEGDPEGFLREIDKLLGGRTFPRRDGDRVRGPLLINRTAGLFFAGRWREALDDLDAVDTGKLPAPFRHLHFNNKLACLNALEDVEGARRWVAENRALIEPPPPHPELALSLEGNLAVLERLGGDGARSRAMLEACLARIERLPGGRKDLLLATTHFHLGRLDLDEGRLEDAKAHFAETVETAPKTFFPEKVAELLRAG